MNMRAETNPCLSGEKYSDCKGNYTMDQKNNGTLSHSTAANIKAKHAALSRVCLYTQGKIPIECIYSLGFSSCVQDIRHWTFVSLVSETKHWPSAVSKPSVSNYLSFLYLLKCISGCECVYMNNIESQNSRMI